MTTRRRRRFTADFKKRVALEALRGDRTVQQIAARHEVHPNQVSQWKRQAIDGLEEVFDSGGRGSGRPQAVGNLADDRRRPRPASRPRDSHSSTAHCRCGPSITGTRSGRRTAEHAASAGAGPINHNRRSAARGCRRPGTETRITRA